MSVKLSQIATHTVLVLGLMFAFQNCGPSGEESSELSKPGTGITQQDITSRYEEIRAVAAADLRCSNASDCEAVPLGHRPCGGPSDYVVASLLNPSYDQVLALAEQLTALEFQYNSSNQIAGTCDLRMPPQVACVAAKCQVD